MVAARILLIQVVAVARVIAHRTGPVASVVRRVADGEAADGHAPAAQTVNGGGYGS
jgi:hypothetical protein